MREEMSRPVAVRSLKRRGEGTGTTEMTVTAEPAELGPIARRLDVPAVSECSCRFALGRVESGGVVPAEGRLRARVERICVVSLEPFVEAIDERFAIRFVPRPAGSLGVLGAAETAGTDEESEEGGLDPDAEDELFYDGESIDLGAAAVEQLALALDPYPRRPDAALPAEAAEAPEEPPEPRNPFAALAALRRPN